MVGDDYAAAEQAWNEGLGCEYKLFEQTTASVRAFSCGTLDRAANEEKHFKDAVLLLGPANNLGRCTSRTPDVGYRQWQRARR